MQINSESGESSAARTAAQRFCSNMSQGMHAIAQPLTVLRASLSLGRTDRMSLDELRKFAASSAIEVERLCALFSCVQQFILTESSEPDLTVLPLAPLVEYAVDGLNRLFQNDGIYLSIVVPERCSPVLVNRERTVHALSNILLIAHSISSAKDTVDVIATCSSNTVQVVIENTNSTVKDLNSGATLSMALAEANFRSQYCGLWWSCRPFSARIEFQPVPFTPQLA